MLSRRHLRVKVMQSIFAISGSGIDIPVGEKNLLKSLEAIKTLYIYQLSFLSFFGNLAIRRIEEGKEKKLPTTEDLNPNTRFVENPLIHALIHSKDLNHEEERCKPNWKDEEELAKRILASFRKSENYLTYMAKSEVAIKDHKEIMLYFFESFVFNNEHLISIYEEKNISWINDLDQVGQMVWRTLDGVTVKKPDLKLVNLYRDKKEDLQFAVDLYRQTISNNEELTKLISSKTQNWDADRIASTDMLLMKMALSEFQYIPSVPTKVTMNEYIEISKEYSTPKSAVFINGVLDKALAELKKDGKVKKSGKGLIDV